MTANQQQTEPELRELLRRFLRGVCVVAAIISTFQAAVDVLMTGQILNDEISAGKIESFLGNTKTGVRLRLDNGHEVVFLSSALNRGAVPIQLAVGDHVEKRSDSYVYVVNGTALTDASWLVREVLLPVQLRVALGAYLLIGTLFVLTYRRTPFGDGVWSDAAPKRPRWPRTRAGLFAAMLVGWLFMFVLMTAVFGCLGSCLSGIGKAAFGR